MINQQSWRRLIAALGFSLSAFVLMWAVQPPEPFGYSAAGWVVVALVSVFIFLTFLRLQEIERRLKAEQQNRSWLNDRTQVEVVLADQIKRGKNG